MVISVFGQPGELLGRLPLVVSYIISRGEREVEWPDRSCNAQLVYHLQMSIQLIVRDVAQSVINRFETKSNAKPKERERLFSRILSSCYS